METTISPTRSFTVNIPATDISFLRSLSRRMGWKTRAQKKSGIEKGPEDIENGNVFQAKNSEDLIKQILG